MKKVLLHRERENIAHFAQNSTPPSPCAISLISNFADSKIDRSNCGEVTLWAHGVLPRGRHTKGSYQRKPDEARLRDVFVNCCILLCVLLSIFSFFL